MVCRCVLLCCLSIAAIAADKQRGDLVVLDPVVEVGTLRGWRSVPLTFRLRNDGAAPIRLQAPGSSCSCLGSSIAVPAELAPGASGELTATMETRVLDDGPMVKQILLRSDVPGQRSTLLRVRGTIEQPLRIEPRDLHLYWPKQAGTDPDLVEATRSVIEVLPPDGPRPVGVACDLPYLDVDLDSPDPDEGRTYHVAVRPKALVPFGSWSGVVTLRTDDAGLPAYHIPVTGHRRAPFAATPVRPVFTADDGAWSAVCHFAPDQPDQWQLQEATVASEGVTIIGAERQAAGTGWRIELRCGVRPTDPITLVTRWQGPEGQAGTITVDGQPPGADEPAIID